MANPYRGQVELSINNSDGSVNVYKLHFDGNTLVELEEVMGVPINVMISRTPEIMMGHRFLRTALFHGLKRDAQGKKLSLAKCGELVGSDQHDEIRETVIQGVMLALGHDYKEALKKRNQVDGGAEEGQDDPLEQGVA